MGNKPVLPDPKNPGKSERVLSNNTKDTKTWCKGVVGREHHGEWQTQGKFYSYERFICTICGKQLAYFGQGVGLPDSLVQLRKAKGWNQQELADAVNNGQNMPWTHKVGRKLCTAEMISALEHSRAFTWEDVDLTKYEMFRIVFRALDFRIVVNLIEITETNRSGQEIPHWMPTGQATTKEE